MRKGVADPEAFDPKNQLNDDGNLKPFAGSHTAFGWGRRICAGQPFAERGLYTMVVHMLWAFNCGPGPNGIPDINSTSLGASDAPGWPTLSDQSFVQALPLFPTRLTSTLHLVPKPALS